jgi:hypothetical protein
MKVSISRRSGGGVRSMLRKTFKMLRKTLFNVVNLVCATSNERSFHRCCKFMCVMLQAAGFATFCVSEKIAQGRTGSLPPPARGSCGGVRARCQTFDLLTVRSGYGAYPPGNRVPPIG